MTDHDRLAADRPICPCGCGCREPMAGIELTWGLCILCHNGEHWQPGDDDPAFDWPAIFSAVAPKEADR